MFVGAVTEPITPERSLLFGACFALDTRTVVTADHVIEAALERGAKALHVLGPKVEAAVEKVSRHPDWDLAILEVEHELEVVPFSVAPPVRGEDVRLHAWTRAGKLSMFTQVAGMVEKVQVASTATTRGTKPEHQVLEPRTVTYAYPGIVLSDAPSKAYSGAPVVNDAGQAIGVLTLRRGGQGIALRLDTVISRSAENTARRTA
jgi:S1-C subfamily serine protease